MATCGLKQEAVLLYQNLEQRATFLIVHTSMTFIHSFIYSHVTLQCPANFLHFLQSENIGSADGDARRKFVSGAKVLAALPTISQPRRVYCELHGNEDKLYLVGKQLSTKIEIQSFGRVFF